METPGDKAGRLLTALEDLAAQESTLLRAPDLFEAGQLAALADRAAPLVLELGVLLDEPSVAPWRPRVEALLHRRRRHALRLDAQVARLQADLQRITEACHRVARVAPVYRGGLSSPAESRLNSAA